MVNKVREIYDTLADRYDEKYVNDRESSYMKDEADAAFIYAKAERAILGFGNGVISLGCGTGQDIEICGHPETFIGFDISPNMLKKAEEKFHNPPNYRFIYHDCNTIYRGSFHLGNTLVSMFGTPNYIGIDMLYKHYITFKCRHAFFVFYNELYKDGVVDNYQKTSFNDLMNAFPWARVRSLDVVSSNYYAVYW